MASVSSGRAAMSTIHSHATQPFISSILGLILLVLKSVGKSVDPSGKAKDSPLCNKTHVRHVPAKKRPFFLQEAALGCSRCGAQHLHVNLNLVPGACWAKDSAVAFPVPNFRAVLAPTESLQPSKHQHFPPRARCMACISPPAVGTRQARGGSEGTP